MKPPEAINSLYQSLPSYSLKDLSSIKELVDKKKLKGVNETHLLRDSKGSCLE